MNKTQNRKTKRCYSCEETKEFFEFYRDKSRKDGHQNRCRICFKAYRKNNKEYIKAYNKAYRENNKEKMAEHKKVWRKDNKEKMTEGKKAHYKTPRGKYTCYKSNAKRRGIDFELTFEQFESFWQLPCTYCGTDIETIGLDRVDSSKGYLIENVATCCWGCNARKGDMVLSEWNTWLSNIAAHNATREEELFIKHYETEEVRET